ncbi:hypothetical protein BCD49_04760 [Pseudofrankia sp. EUN1h]|nr:hypothetical protein BCD49_04760 [Pseudofrankia sp. EUN1h]
MSPSGNGTLSTRPPLSRLNRAGLGLATALGVLNLAGPALPLPSFAASGPVAATLAFSVLMGVITVVSVVILLTTRSRTAFRVVAASRMFSVLTAIPAFFRDVVPSGLVVSAALWVLVNVVAVELMVEPGRAPLRLRRS